MTAVLDRGPSSARTPTKAHLTYAPGLDGVRAVAVVLVFVYHLGAGWLPGGFLGVDVFFVLSGYLITTVLLREWDSRGIVDIRQFWLHRARRLLPALYAMLTGVVLVSAVVARSELARLRGDVGAALTYSTNWTQIAWRRSYFQSLGRPSLLQHLWSLAVEEQFYLVWPIVLVLCLITRRHWVPLAVALGGAGLSTVLMAVGFHAGTDPARIYYGSDTHLAPVLIGAALALAPLAHRRIDRPAALGAVVLAGCVLLVGYDDAALYRGGYVVVALAAAAVVRGAATPGSVTSRVLSVGALRWIGVRSYAIYLWHWPVFMLTRPGIDLHVSSDVVLVLRVGLTVGLAALSYRFIEQPVRTRGFRIALTRTGIRGGAGLIAVLALLLATAPSGGVQVDHSARRTVHVVAPPSPFGRPVNVTFFGDSQGMTLLLNQPAGLDGDVTLHDGTVEGCGILLGTIASTRETRNLTADCGSWPTKWQAAVTRDHPQIAAVEIGAWEVFDDTVNGTRLTFGTPAWDAYFTSQLAVGTSLLTKAGAQVALIGVPCYRPVDGGGLLALPERGQDVRTHHIDTLLQAAAAKNPRRIYYVTPPAQFCSDPTISTNTSYRWDGVHFYKPGAALEFETITPQLLKIPRPS